MTKVAHSTIAQAIYADPQKCSFVRVVTELEGLLSRLRNSTLRTRWDYEDVVVFDLGETRILLGWSENRADEAPACLLVSVGPLPSAEGRPQDVSYELLCSRLIERIQTRYPPDAVLWRQLPLAMEPELVDALIDAIPLSDDILGPQTAPKPSAAVRDPAVQRLALLPANDTPHLPVQADTELRKLRAALYPELETPGPVVVPETVQLRLAAQAMNATLIVVYMPLGVAAMTYSLMRGGTIGFSARMMAVTGTVIGWSQTPIGQQVAALAGA